MVPPDRRLHRRSAPLTTLKASIRPGVRVSIVDISDHGAAIQASHALRPNTVVLLCLVEDGRRTFRRATVLRSSVTALSPVSVIYHAALRFEDAPGRSSVTAGDRR